MANDDPVKRLAAAATDLSAFRISNDGRKVRIVTVVDGRTRVGRDLDADQLDELIRVLQEHRKRLG